MMFLYDIEKRNPLHRVFKVDNDTMSEVGGFDGLHIFGGELEVHDVKVLSHTLLMKGLQDNNYFMLNRVSKSNL